MSESRRLGCETTHYIHRSEERARGIATARSQHRGRSDWGRGKFVGGRSGPRIISRDKYNVSVGTYFSENTVEPVQCPLRHSHGGC